MKRDAEYISAMMEIGRYRKALEDIHALPMDHAQPCRIIASEALGWAFGEPAPLDEERLIALGAALRAALSGDA
jgi:hypothetical protein